MQKGEKRTSASYRLKIGLRKYGVNYLALMPFFILFIAFILVPMIQGIAMSFTDWSTSSKGKINFVGIDNYLSLFSGKGSASKRFIISLKNLLIYVPITVFIGLSIALILALVVGQLRHKAYNFFRGSFFFPTVLPLFLCAGIWQWYMSSDSGLIASALADLGIGQGVIWKDTAGYAIALVILVDVWNSVGLNFVIYSTAMQDISPDLYEAASIDGASTLDKMLHITIPMLEPTLFFTITYSFISALQVYDIPWILTSSTDISAVGGANQVMLFPVMEMVRNVYQGGKSALGRAAAEGVILMAIILVITAIQYKFRKKKV